MRKIFLSAILVVFVFIIESQINFGHECQEFPCSKYLNKPYGMVAHLSKRELDYPYIHQEISMMKDIGVNYVRVGFSASDISKDSTGFHTEVWDTVFETLSKENIEILPILDRTIHAKPAWDKIKEYQEYLKYILGKYRTHYWELMNEADLYPTSVFLDSLGRKQRTYDFAASGLGYMSCLPVFSEAIKNGINDNKVVFTGIASSKNGFFDTICVHQGYRYFDVMNFHTYAEPERIPIIINRIRKSMKKYGWEKPIWITECGMHTALTGESWRTEKEQAQRLARIYLLSFAYGVDKVFWYNFRALEKDASYKEDHFGIVHKDLKPKPAYFAYKALTTMCPNGSTRPVCVNDGKLYFIRWMKPNGVKVEAVWTTSKERVKVAISEDAAYYDYLGNSIPKPQYANKGIVYIVHNDK